MIDQFTGLKIRIHTKAIAYIFSGLVLNDKHACLFSSMFNERIKILRI